MTPQPLTGRVLPLAASYDSIASPCSRQPDYSRKPIVMYEREIRMSARTPLSATTVTFQSIQAASRASTAAPAYRRVNQYLSEIRSCSRVRLTADR
jgi:hypothetical protein